MESEHEDSVHAEAVYADLVRLYPDDVRYLRRYAEALIANGKHATATEILRRAHDLLIRAGERHEASELTRQYPQIGRVHAREEDVSGTSLFLAMAEECAGGKLLAAMRRKRLKEGEHLFRRGDPGESMGVVISGELAVYVPDETGRLILLNMIGPGSVVGEGSVLSANPRGADVVANKDSTIIEIPRKKALAYLLEHPEVEAALMSEYEQRHMVSLLSRNPALRRIPVDMRHFLGKQAEIARYDAGALIRKGGAPLDAVDMLTRGRAQYMMTAPSGKRLPILELPMGQLIGDLSILRDKADAGRRMGCPADIIAMEDVMMAHIPYAAFKNVVEAYPPLRETLLRTVDAQLAEISRKVAERATA